MKMITNYIKIMASKNRLSRSLLFMFALFLVLFFPQVTNAQGREKITVAINQVVYEDVGTVEVKDRKQGHKVKITNMWLTGVFDCKSDPACVAAGLHDSPVRIRFTRLSIIYADFTDGVVNTTVRG